ncbi:MAG: amidase family protein [Alphaproteobacteria bacterium]
MTREWHDMTALELGAGIGQGQIDPVTLAEHFLERIAAQDPEHAIYLRTTPDRARAEAQAARARAGAGLRRGPLDGVPVSWKDLFDTAGVATTAATPLLADRVPERDCAVLARATRAGLVCLGKTNLTEFAFSGLAINPHYGTPANPFDGDVARVPGGSSAGAAVAVARGLAAAAVGTDTGGSVRIPAGWNGLVGLKTSAGLLPLDGVIPLAPSLDTVGPLSRDVADANALFAVLARRPAADLAGARLAGARIVVPTNVAVTDAESGVAAAVERALERLAQAGAEVVREDVSEFTETGDLIARYGYPAGTEGYAQWRDVIESRPYDIYHNVLKRFREGAEVAAVDFLRLRAGLAALAERLHARLAGMAAMALATSLIAPPPITDLVADDDAYTRANLAALRNTTLGNLLNLCAVTLPCGDNGEGLPVGLMLVARPFHEAALLRLAAACEAALAAIPKPSPAAPSGD